MKAPQENTQEPQKETVQRVEQEPSTGGEAVIADNRPAVAVQRKLRSAMGGTDDNTNPIPIQRKVNKTGLPDTLKSGIENLSGYSMDDVKVHYNSSKPAQLQAHAYAQGTDIHLGSGQEKHLPHEAWHVVQQKQGRVKPTMQFKGKVNVNDDAGLEKEADVMGNKALRSDQEGSNSNNLMLNKPKSYTGDSGRIVQRKPTNVLSLISSLSGFAGIEIGDYRADENNENIVYISTVLVEMKGLPFTLNDITLTLDDNATIIDIDTISSPIKDGELLLRGIDITLSGDTTIRNEVWKRFISSITPTFYKLFHTLFYGEPKSVDLLQAASINIKEISIPKLTIGKDGKTLHLCIKNLNLNSGITNKLPILFSFLTKGSKIISEKIVDYLNVKKIKTLLGLNDFDDSGLRELLLGFLGEEGLNISFGGLELKTSEGVNNKNSNEEGSIDEINIASEQSIKMEGFKVGEIDDERKMHIATISGGIKGSHQFNLGDLTMTLGQNTTDINISEITLGEDALILNGTTISINGDITLMTQLWKYLVPYLVSQLSGKAMVIPAELDDLLESVSVDIDSVSIPKQTKGNDQEKGTKTTKLDIKDLKLVAFSMNKLPILLSFLAKHSQEFVEKIISVTGVSDFGEGNLIELFTGLLGKEGMKMSIGEVKQEIFEGSETKRLGKGSYTGKEGKLQTHYEKHGTNTLTNLDVIIKKDPYEKNQVLTNINLEKFEKNIEKNHKVKSGKRYEKKEKDHLVIKNFEAKIANDRNNFDVIESAIEFESLILHKGGVRILISNLETKLDDSVTGEIWLKVEIFKSILRLVVFDLNIKVEKSKIELKQVEKEIRKELLKNNLPPSTVLMFVRKKIFNYLNAGVLRRTFDVFDPTIEGTDRDVVDLKPKSKKKATHIKLKNIFDYHASAKNKKATGNAGIPTYKNTPLSNLNKAQRDYILKELNEEDNKISVDNHNEIVLALKSDNREVLKTYLVTSIRTGGLFIKKMKNDPDIPLRVLPQVPGYVLNRTEGDGNCFYYALYEAINNGRPSRADSGNMRTRLATALRTPNQQYYTNADAQVWFTPVNDLITNVAADTVWTRDELNVHVAAAVLGYTIHVHQRTQSTVYNRNRNAPNNPNAPNGIIHIFYNGHTHWQSYTPQRLPLPLLREDG